MLNQSTGDNSVFCSMSSRLIKVTVVHVLCKVIRIIMEVDETLVDSNNIWKKLNEVLRKPLTSHVVALNKSNGKFLLSSPVTSSLLHSIRDRILSSVVFLP